MFQGVNRNRIHSCNDDDTMLERFLDPSDIYIIRGYGVEVFINNLDAPSSMVFDEEGNIFISDSGRATDHPRILKLVNGQFETIADDFVTPISGINYLHGILYVSHRGFITKIYKDGTRQNIIMGLPSNGDHINSPVAFFSDNKI